MGALNTKKVFFVLRCTCNAEYHDDRCVSPLPYGKPADSCCCYWIALGGFVQFAFQLPAFFRNGYSLGFDQVFAIRG